MQPRYPLTQAFAELPGQLPIHLAGHALLPGGELPLEFAAEAEIALCRHALRTDQLLGVLQPLREAGGRGGCRIGGAGRIRQYRERRDGRINVMLTGVCRFRMVEALRWQGGARIARVDWRGFEQDYATEVVDPLLRRHFTTALRGYFDRHRMKVNWKLLDQQSAEHLVNNLVLVIDLGSAGRQSLLEADTVSQRLHRFAELLERKAAPMPAPAAGAGLVS